MIAYLSRIVQPLFDGGHDSLHITPSFEESELLAEGQFTYDIKGIYRNLLSAISLLRENNGLHTIL